MAKYKKDGWGPVTIYVPEDQSAEWSTLERLADADRRSLSYMVNLAVEQYAQAKRELEEEIKEFFPDGLPEDETEVYAPEEGAYPADPFAEHNAKLRNH